MWTDYESEAFTSSDSKFPLLIRDLGECGRWKYLHRIETTNISVSLGIWHQSLPLQRIRNASTSAVIDLLENQLERRLNPYSRYPVALPKALDMSYQETGLHTERGEIDVLRHIIQCILVMGRKFESVAKTRRWYQAADRHSPLIQWTTNDAHHEYPEPDLTSIYTSRAHAKATLLVLRHPTMYDGDTGLMLQRYMSSALDLLFTKTNTQFIADSNRDICLKPSSQPPSFVIYEGPEFTNAARDAMAKVLHPTLVQLVRRYEEKPVLPSHCYVYGIHLSPTYLSLCIHLPTRMTNLKTGAIAWYFRQVLVARYRIATNPNSSNMHENLILTRWRLLVSLLTVLKHVQLLDAELHYVKSETVAARSCSMEYPICPLQPHSLPNDLDILRRTWICSRLPIPLEWTTPNGCDEPDFTDGRELMTKDLGRDLLHQLTSFVVDKLRRHVVLISPATIMDNHLDINYHGPDFLLPRHTPLNQFNIRGIEVVQDPLHNTQAHMYRTYDFIMLSTSGWHDFNGLVAKLFSGFAGYAVQWKPTIRYPFPSTNQSSQLCALDFALAVCTTPATNRITIERARFLPLTISSPAVLIGCHANCLDSDGRLVSQDEIETLTQMMRPHLQVFNSYTQYKTFAPDNVAIDPRPYLFCTYIKSGFLHLLAFRLVDQTDIKTYLIDSLPLSLECRGDEDMKNRLRAATALFTLQKEIVKLCETWGMISWPVEVLADEHEAIMEVTGICSPTPTETIPEYETGSKPILVNLPGTCLEDDPAFIAKQVTKSIERVTPWLAQVQTAMMRSGGSARSMEHPACGCEDACMEAHEAHLQLAATS